MFRTLYMYDCRKDTVLFPIVMPSARAMVIIKKLKGNQRVSFMATAVSATGNQDYSDTLTLILLKPKVISLFHQYRSRPACNPCSLTRLYTVG